MQEKYYEEIIRLAKRAYKKGEVPVGAIIVKNGKVLAKAYNMVEKDKNATLHAEILAIKKASKKLKNWRLNGCEMYVTLEPCDMCTGAIKLSRISKVYYMVKKNDNNNSNQEYIHLSQYSDEFKKMIQDFFSEIRR